MTSRSWTQAGSMLAAILLVAACGGGGGGGSEATGTTGGTTPGGTTNGGTTTGGTTTGGSTTGGSTTDGTTTGGTTTGGTTTGGTTTGGTTTGGTTTGGTGTGGTTPPAALPRYINVTVIPWTAQGELRLNAVVGATEGDSVGHVPCTTACRFEILASTNTLTVDTFMGFGVRVYEWGGDCANAGTATHCFIPMGTRTEFDVTIKFGGEHYEGEWAMKISGTLTSPENYSTAYESSDAFYVEENHDISYRFGQVNGHIQPSGTNLGFPNGASFSFPLTLGVGGPVVCSFTGFFQYRWAYGGTSAPPEFPPAADGHNAIADGDGSCTSANGWRLTRVTWRAARQ